MQSLNHLRTPFRRPANWLGQFTHQGFTAIELLIVIAIVAVLAALAGPSFVPIMERWRVRQTVEEMTSTLYYARSEAVKRGGNVVIAKQPDKTNGCTLAPTNEDWGCGWFVFVDANGDGTQQSTEETLQSHLPAARVQVTIPKNGGIIRIDRWGMANGINAVGMSFIPEGKKVSDPASSALCMASGGRIRTIPGDGTC